MTNIQMNPVTGKLKRNKKTIILALLAVMVSGCKTAISVAEQESGIVGVWNFPKDRLVMEITETHIGKYGGKMSTEYKILNKKELLEREGGKENVRKYKLHKKDNNLMLLEGKKQKHFGERIKIQPNTNLVGRYITETPDKAGITYIEIIDENNALAGDSVNGDTVSMKYIALKQNLLLIHNGYYGIFERNDAGFLFKAGAGIEVNFKKAKKELIAMYTLDEQGEILEEFIGKPVTVCVETKGFVQGELVNLNVSYPFGRFAGGIDTLKFQAKVEKDGKAYQRNIILEPEETDAVGNTDTSTIDCDYDTLTVKDRYKFQNFPTQIYDGELSPPDFGNNPFASDEEYVAFITEGCEETGINFGGHFTILEKSCGTCCSSIFIIDRRNGHIFTDVKATGYDEETGAYGYTYRKGSLLLIANSELFIDDKYEQYNNYMCLKPKFYVWLNSSNEFMLIDK